MSLNQLYQTNNFFGAAIAISGMVDPLQLGILGGYSNGGGSSANSNLSGFGQTTTTTGIPLGFYGANQFNQSGNNSLSTMYKNRLYNREKFMAFLPKLEGKTMIFEGNGKKKVVESKEALKLVLFHYLAAKDYKNWDNFEYRDDEWHIYFKTPTTSDEHSQSFKFTPKQIGDLLNI